MGAAKCKARVFGGFETVRCQNKAKRDGYCGVHHPDARASRRAKRAAKWAREAEEHAARHAATPDAKKLRAFPKLVEALEIVYQRSTCESLRDHGEDCQTEGLMPTDEYCDFCISRDALDLAREASE